VLAAACFALASSACYIFNDLRDVDADRAHPRKRLRPIASGAVSVASARVMMALCLAASVALALWLVLRGAAPALGIFLAAYVLNVVAYSITLKHRPVADVLSLSMGFVLRVLAGCAAASIVPSTWLLNCALFLAMFLAFGKRLGERRTAESQGFDVTAARKVQGAYSDSLLRMALVVTGVATLVTYASYVQAQQAATSAVLLGFTMNWLWLTTVPACYLLLRCVLLLDEGRYDDPTEMLTRDFPLQASALAFAVLTASSFILAASA
jgi:decaprenyl-phosphate phosphoribosyltransferase